MATEEVQAEVQGVAEAIYYSPRYPSLVGSFPIKDEEGNTVQKRFQLQSGQLKLSDPEEIKALDREIATRPALSATLKKIDVATAEEAVRKHQERRLARSKAAAGPFTTQSMAQMTGQERLHAALGSEASPETVAAVQEALSEEGLEVAEDVSVQQIPDPSVVGVDPAKEEPAQEEKKGPFFKK